MDQSTLFTSPSSPSTSAQPSDQQHVIAPNTLNGSAYPFHDPDEVRRFATEIRQVSPLRQERAAMLTQSGLCSQQVAADALGVTKIQVQRALKAIKQERDVGRVGHPTAMNAEEEKKLVQFIQEQHQQGRSYTPTQLAAQALKIVRERQPGHKAFSSTVIRNFLCRHPNLEKVTPRSMEPERLITTHQMKPFFDSLREWKRSNPNSPPALISNFDETMAWITPEKKVKVVVPRDTQLPFIKGAPKHA